MLKQVSGAPRDAGVKISKAAFPAPFVSGLEYGAPARGTWNIVHTGMLLPQAHEIFVCAAGCLRGVVLTAAEMNAAERFSTIAVRENNVLDGDMEELIIDGTADILEKLPNIPPAVLLYTSCIHHFMACNMDRVFRVLRQRFPDVDFTDCYMNPIMRKSGLTPDQLMRRQLYSLLKPRALNPKSVNIIGNDLATDPTSELCRVIREAGFTLRDITSCKTYDEYQEMAESIVNITYNPAAVAGGEALAKRLNTKHIYLPVSYDLNAIQRVMDDLCDILGVPRRDFSSERKAAEAALESAFECIGETPIEIDYTLTIKPLGLARILLEHGFNVTAIYADGFSGEEQDDFEWLQRTHPDLVVHPTVGAGMRFLTRTRSGKTLALGQKAAYFTGSDNFVNVVEGGGMYGYDGISRLCTLMTDAYLHEKDAKSLIQIKGMGCGCCS